MSTELYTEFNINGSHDELMDVLKMLRGFETYDEQCRSKKRNGLYLKNVEVNNKKISELSDRELQMIMVDSVNNLWIAAEGPYGEYMNLIDCGLFEQIADAAPAALLNGFIVGYDYTSDVNLSLHVSMDKGKLYLTEEVISADDLSNAFYNYIHGKLSYKKFCGLFKVNTDEFDEDDYWDFIYNVLQDCGFQNLEYENFIEVCPNAALEESEYADAIDEARECGVTDLITFWKEKFDTRDYTIKREYIPPKED